MELIKASLMAAAGGGGNTPNLQPISISQNGRYRAGVSPYESIDGWNDISVAVPQKDEITGEFSENGEYTPPTGKVWNHIIISVDAELETQKSYKDLTDFFDDEIKFTNKGLTWKTEHFSGSEPRTITFGNQTISNVYAGCFMYVWLDGEEYRVIGNYWTYAYSGYRYDSVSNAQVVPQSGSTPAYVRITHTYDNNVGHFDAPLTITFPLGTTVEEMNDGTGYRITN